MSKNCFIAISFSDEMIDTENTIVRAVNLAEYNPILIRNINYESHITINDAIIKNIKQCKFLIADFTGQRHNVYFEAGFALGLKRPVIYVCSLNDFKNCPFDTNHFPHIIYKDLKELESKLIDKIQAWID